MKEKEKINTGILREKEITKEMEESYIDYAMSVIVSRALPDLRDGLKPVQRRILYTMYEDGLTSNAKFRKSASAVGNCMARYHPHGDAPIYEALARMAQNFSLRYPLIEGQGNFGCFTKDTKIKLCDGRNLNFEELIKEQKEGKRHWTFTFNLETKKIEISEIKNPRLTRKNERIIEITLDNGEKIKSTLDHKFMLRDGSFKEAKDLKPGDSLMPVYIKLYDGEDKNLKGCSMIYQPIEGTWEFIHHLRIRWQDYWKYLMRELTEKTEASLRKKWKNPQYKERVVKSKILGYVYALLNKYPKITPKIDEKEKYNNFIPRLENALKYFSGFSEILTESQKYNHKVIKTKILSKREDVYDLTIEPWHNFALAAGVFVHNSIDGDPPASMRYTEARLSKIGEEMLRDIEKNTVDFIPNYDGTKKEPQTLPSPFPQLILNGALGIAVGMATNIPPHNLNEVLDSLIFLLDHPKAETEDLFKFIKGPDFPTGGQVFDLKSMIEAYSIGRGPILVRGKAEIVEEGKRSKIVITEIPYQVLKSSLLEQIAKIVEEKRIEGIRFIRDESDKEGLRIVIELKSEAQPKKILNALYKFTDLQKTFHLNMLALSGGIQPKIMGLVELLSEFLDFRKEIVLRRTKFDLEKAKERAHILEGIEKCLAKIEKVISTIRNSKDRQEAQKKLMKNFDLDQIQANAILEIKLASLARLERKKIEKEFKDLKLKIKELEAILKSPKKVKEVMKKEFEELKLKFKSERKTQVFTQKIGEISEEELIPEGETIIVLTRGGYIKRVNPRAYRIQKRGGRGVIGIETNKEDQVEHFLVANTKDNLLFFVESGKVFSLPVYEIPEESRLSKGRSITNFLEISSQEKILALLSIGKEDFSGQTKFLVMATKNGIIKKTPLEDFKKVRRSGLIAISLKKGDILKSVQKSTGQDDLILVTKNGQAIRFNEREIRPMGRKSAGIKGIKLKNDELVGVEKITKKEKIKQYLLTLTENGFGKRTDIKEYKIQKRGGMGIKAAKINEKTGKVVVFKVLTNEEDLIAISKTGQVIRTKIASIPKLKRQTQGLRIMKLEPGDKLASATCF